MFFLFTPFLMTWFTAMVLAQNSTFTNPVLPGFYPDPSCIFVQELNHTLFCASSSFLAFPGLPITASQNLQDWSLISNAFSRQDQLPDFAGPLTETGGIWAPTLRFRNGTFFLTSTLVLDYLPVNDSSRWRNFILTTTDPYNSLSWSQPLFFEANGYDSSLFWDSDGQTYVTWAGYPDVLPGIFQAVIDLKTGEIGQALNIWNGTGGEAPEGPHIYRKDGFYYLMIAEGGTFLGHMETIARSRNVNGPYEPNPGNPILTNANTTEYFQAVGHADLFQDVIKNWWGVGHAIRINFDNKAIPMGRETVLFPVTWDTGEWPVMSPVRGRMSGWASPSPVNNLVHSYTTVVVDDNIDFVKKERPKHLVHWRYPNDTLYNFTPTEEHCGLQLLPSAGNLSSTKYNDGASDAVTLLLRRQSHSFFTFSVDFDISHMSDVDEVGATVFISEATHFSLGITQPASAETNGTARKAAQLRFRGNYNDVSTERVVPTMLLPVLEEQRMTLEIKACNTTHYAFSASPTAHQSAMKIVDYAPAALLRPIFTGNMNPHEPDAILQIH
ncbi:xylosidase arabinofuranosidase [Colletotrichum acutatum]